MIKFDKASLFDLDQTLLTVNSSYSFGRYLYQKKVISLPCMLYCIGCYSLHKIGRLSLSHVHKKIFKSLFSGKPHDQFLQLAEHFVSENIDQLLYIPAVKRLKEAQHSGHFTAILSSSPSFLVKLIAGYLSVNDYRATEYRVDKENQFISVGEVMDGETKALFLQEFSKKSNIKIENITAYSDSFLDLPFLMQVGTPIGVNPDTKLRGCCIKKGWEII